MIWFNYFDENKDFFSALFSSKSTASFRKQLLNFMMNQLSKKINNISSDKDPEILLRFLSMAVLGILESFILMKSQNNNTLSFMFEVRRRHNNYYYISK